MCLRINNIAIRGAVTIAKTAVTSHEAPPPWVNGLRQGRRSPLFNRFASPFGKTPSRSRWVSQSLLNLEDTRHPLFAYYRQQWGQVWARSHAYQLTMKRKLERIERAGEATEGASLTTEAKTSRPVHKYSNTGPAQTLRSAKGNHRRQADPKVCASREFQGRCGIWQQRRARDHQLSPILSQNRRKTSKKGYPHPGIRPEPEYY